MMTLLQRSSTNLFQPLYDPVNPEISCRRRKDPSQRAVPVQLLDSSSMNTNEVAIRTTTASIQFPPQNATVSPFFSPALLMDR